MNPDPGATLMHLCCSRRSEADNGWIRRLTEEAENERMHLMTFIQIALAPIDAGLQADVAAPEIAVDYWKLPAQATLRDVNHGRADELHRGDEAPTGTARPAWCPRSADAQDAQDAQDALRRPAGVALPCAQTAGWARSQAAGNEFAFPQELP